MRASCTALRKARGSSAPDTYFPPNIRVIAEPGRYYVATAYTLAANVIARRDIVLAEATANIQSVELMTDLGCLIEDHACILHGLEDRRAWSLLCSYCLYFGRQRHCAA
jgi:hypothetical protein